MLTPSDLDALAELERKCVFAAPWEYDSTEMYGLPSPSRMHTEDGREGWCFEAAGDELGAFIVAVRNTLPELIRLARIGMAAEQRGQVPMYDPMLHSQDTQERGA